MRLSGILLIPLVLCQVVFQDSVQPRDYTIGDDSLLAFHKNLVQISSIHPNEYEVAKYLEEFLTARGLVVELQPVADLHSYNVYSYVKSRDNKVVLTSHIDTVPPFIDYRIDGGRIYGRGTCDAKGSVAAQVFAYLSLLESGQIKDGDVALLFVVGEEVDGIGMKVADLQLNTTWDIGIFGEPTELKLGVGHKGGISLNIEVNGLASHSGYPELGISASEILIPVLNDLMNTKYPVNELLGPTTLNVGKISVGVAMNVIPAHAEAQLYYRVSDNITELQEVVENKLRGIDHLNYTIDVGAPPQYLDYDVPGFDSVILAYNTDIPRLHKNFKKRYLYGPGTIRVAHGDNEYVDVSDLVDAVDGYSKLVLYSL